SPAGSCLSSRPRGNQADPLLVPSLQIVRGHPVNLQKPCQRPQRNPHNRYPFRMKMFVQQIPEKPPHSAPCRHRQSKLDHGLGFHQVAEPSTQTALFALFGHRPNLSLWRTPLRKFPHFANFGSRLLPPACRYTELRHRHSKRALSCPSLKANSKKTCTTPASKPSRRLRNWARSPASRQPKQCTRTISASRLKVSTFRRSAANTTASPASSWKPTSPRSPSRGASSLSGSRARQGSRSYSRAANDCKSTSAKTTSAKTASSFTNCSTLATTSASKVSSFALAPTSCPCTSKSSPSLPSPCSRCRINSVDWETSSCAIAVATLTSSPTPGTLPKPLPTPTLSS